MNALFFSVLYGLIVITSNIAAENQRNVEPIQLKTIQKNITVKGRESSVLALSQLDGTLGARFNKGHYFDLLLTNAMKVPTSIHWHGLILPNGQDGVAFVTQLPIYPSLTYHYYFPLVQSGTYWMHSHYSLQEQKLLSAPLIIYDDEDNKIAEQEAILFLADFSFKEPSEIYRELSCNKKHDTMQMSKPDIVEVDYDAFLTNYRTLEDPDVVRVEPGKKVRLRIINGSSATNFFIQLGKLEGELIAVDGNKVKPLKGTEFEVAVAQRIDILVTTPGRGYFPILAKGEGTDKQTGLILAAGDNLDKLPNIEMTTAIKAGALTNAQEKALRAVEPLATKPVDQRIKVDLGGNMSEYKWTMNGQSWPNVTPIVVEKGQRVEITLENTSTMSHPMHLHGHVFEVTAIDGKSFEGAIRDTVLVTPKSSVTIQFDANNPGVWPFHCHVLYHLEAGMMTVVRYKDFIQPLLK